MNNIGLSSLETNNVNNFTTINGLKIRKAMNKPFRYILKKATKGNTILERYPKLEKDQPYIFASTHSHTEDVISNLSIIDRNAYVLIGTTDQVRHNPQMYMAWANGMIYVNRLDNNNRNEALKKMQWLLDNGTSVLVFVEGGYNNSENLLCQRPFPGVYRLNVATGAKIVPIANFLDPDTNNIYIRVGDPMDLSIYNKKIALDVLRDSLATMVYEQIETHTKPLKRASLSYDPHLDYMEARRQEYFKVNWTSYEAWKEELTVYKGGLTFPDEVWNFIDKVDINEKNAKFYGPVLARKYRENKYSMDRYMQEKWNK